MLNYRVRVNITPRKRVYETVTVRANENRANTNCANAHTFPIKADRTIPIDARLQLQRNVCEFEV